MAVALTIHNNVSCHPSSACFSSIHTTQHKCTNNKTSRRSRCDRHSIKVVKQYFQEYLFCSWTWIILIIKRQKKLSTFVYFQGFRSLATTFVRNRFTYIAPAELWWCLDLWLNRSFKWIGLCDGYKSDLFIQYDSMINWSCWCVKAHSQKRCVH